MTNKAKQHSMSDGKGFLSGVFLGIEDQLQADLKREVGRTTHDATLGGNCEHHWRELLQKYLPARYGVAEAFVVDSNGKTSDQIDVVIYDTLYTPVLFGHGHVQYLPRESVYAVLEIKPTVSKEYLEYAGGKARSVQLLHCSSASIVNAGQALPPRETFPVLTGLLALDASWADGLGAKSFKENLPTDDQRRLDFVLTAESGFYDGRDPSTPEIVTGPGSLMIGLFRILQALQQLGTVPAIDWRVYEEVLWTSPSLTDT